jgi:hypothetical protein
MTTTTARPTPTLPRTAAFWLVGAILLVFMFAAAAPSPLYVVYQARWGFSATTLTIVFAVYAVALLLALVTVGALSDHVGRRPILVAALLVEIAAMVVFVTVGNVEWLLVARAVQGLATGTAAGTVSAYLVDLSPDARTGPLVSSSSPALGLAAGAVGSGVLVQYAPHPTTLVFLLLIALFVAAAAGVLLMPETVRRHEGALASLRPRAGVPQRLRAATAAARVPGRRALVGRDLGVGWAVPVAGAVAGRECAAPAQSRGRWPGHHGPVRGGCAGTRPDAGPQAPLGNDRRHGRARCRCGDHVAGVGAGQCRPVLRGRGGVRVRVRGRVLRRVPHAGRPGPTGGTGGAVRGRVRGVLPGVQPARDRGRHPDHQPGLAATATGYGVAVLALAVVAVGGLLARARTGRTALTCPTAS